MLWFLIRNIKYTDYYSKYNNIGIKDLQFHIKIILL